MAGRFAAAARHQGGPATHSRRGQPSAAQIARDGAHADEHGPGDLPARYDAEAEEADRSTDTYRPVADFRARPWPESERAARCPWLSVGPAPKQPPALSAPSRVPPVMYRTL